MKRAFPSLIVALSLAAVFLPACSDDDADPPNAGAGAGGGGAAAVDACEAIVEACHPLDTGSGTPHDCHELAESSSATAAICESKKAECLAACVGAGGGAGAAGHAEEEGGAGGAHGGSGGAAGSHDGEAGAAGAHDHQH